MAGKHTAPGKNRKLYAAVRHRQAKTLLTLAFGIIAALAITALLSSHPVRTEPVEAAAPAESGAAEPTASPDPFGPDFEQLSDWRLVLVNDEVPLPEDYEMTPRLYSDIQVNFKIYDELCMLLDDAYASNVSLWLASGYRSVEEQEQILENAVQSRMRDGMTREEAYEHARLTIQAPGHSEHHTGLAVDFNDVSSDFRNTEAYAWLQENAAKYGFVERYPADKEDITGINYESWHYRYVGREHAEAMQSLGMCLEEYVLYLKGQS
ncbi:MAG: M15 family metallopeptidase [Hominenteromicrobium sp.]